MESTAIYVVGAAVLVAFFVLLWWWDARRARRQANDPERLDVDNEHPHGAHPGGAHETPTDPSDGPGTSTHRPDPTQRLDPRAED
jgi:hypothetical protein